MKRIAGAAVMLSAGILAMALVVSMFELPPPAVRLPQMVQEKLPQSGVEHPVTAVLLNFRGYDTLLEVAVLLLALLGMLAGERPRPAAPDRAPTDPVLPGLTRFLVPLMGLTAVYLLWAGAHRPGGAFQAAAVLAAAAVLLHLTDLLPAWTSLRLRLRTGLAGGLLVFITVAAWLLGEGRLLQYPVAHAGSLILFIEVALTISLGLILAGLFLFLPDDDERRR
ncbi:MAG TPA: Na(+)/H(+) antiporter subunit B [Candidatus Accumulibacter phosphatis]|nr:MAG: putative monovalent cation/H+ antiporter subunit B [Candidatus Accumulibacter sp. SK-11]HRL75351.1 Na(+)/H(+) antiporter subunit B [Candidatus Accumulibacter phosphatis]HRQ96794.1 Na(+)/H(+) antiporter subunit B [Candidatus Accumulibacter phosphatis]